MDNALSKPEEAGRWESIGWRNRVIVARCMLGTMIAGSVSHFAWKASPAAGSGALVLALLISLLAGLVAVGCLALGLIMFFKAPKRSQRHTLSRPD